MALLNDIKGLLRITNSAFDIEIIDLISAARQDLILSGVLESKADSDSDVLIKRAISVYCKLNFGYDNPDYERLLNSYDMLKRHLCLSSEYTVVE